MGKINHGGTPHRGNSANTLLGRCQGSSLDHRVRADCLYGGWSAARAIAGQPVSTRTRGRARGKPPWPARVLAQCGERGACSLGRSPSQHNKPPPTNQGNGAAVVAGDTASTAIALTGTMFRVTATASSVTESKVPHRPCRRRHNHQYIAPLLPPSVSPLSSFLFSDGNGGIINGWYNRRRGAPSPVFDPAGAPVARQHRQHVSLGLFPTWPATKSPKTVSAPSSLPPPQQLLLDFSLPRRRRLLGDRRIPRLLSEYLKRRVRYCVKGEDWHRRHPLTLLLPPPPTLPSSPLAAPAEHPRAIDDITTPSRSTCVAPVPGRPVLRRRPRRYRPQLTPNKNLAVHTTKTWFSRSNHHHHRHHRHPSPVTITATDATNIVAVVTCLGCPPMIRHRCPLLFDVGV